jgi:hypothetical protein
MKKNLSLLLAFLAIAFFANAQKQQPFNPNNYDPIDPGKDQKVVQGYIVRLRPGINLTYLFDILQNGKLVHEASPNILNTTIEGYDSKEQAYDVAEWVIDEYKKAGRIPSTIPPHIATQLKLKPINATH